MAKVGRSQSVPGWSKLRIGSCGYRIVIVGLIVVVNTLRACRLIPEQYVIMILITAGNVSVDLFQSHSLIEGANTGVLGCCSSGKC